MRNRQRVLCISLVLLFLSSTILSVVPNVFANDLPDALSLSYYITPNDPQVINVAKIICGPDFGKTDFWTVRSNVENLYHWVAGSVPHGIPTHITYKSDQDQWGTSEYWQLSNTTLTLGTGDDADQAILLASLVIASGVPNDRVRIAQYGVYRLEFPWWGFGLISFEKERLFTYYAVEVYDISEDPLNLIYHNWWTPLHPTTTNLLGWPLPFASCEFLGNSAFENPICARRLKPETYFYEKNATDPKARFNYFPQIPRINETVSFDASTSTPDGGYIAKYCWDFGDGTSMNVTAPTLLGVAIPSQVYHTYGTEGNYTATLTVLDSEARSNSTSKTIQVQGLPDTTPPNIAIISPTNTTYSTGIIDLNYTINEPPSWTGCTVDDGAYIANATIAGNTTLYVTNGPHNVQIFANDSSGNMGASQKIYFTVLQPPVANFTWSPLMPIVGDVVTFNGSSSTTNGGVIVSYAWNFGDGGTGSGETPTHVYSSAGNYTVCLNVTDSNNLWNTTQAQVQVIPEGVHEVNVTNITAPEWVYKDVRPVRDCANISVTVSNLGNFPEDAWVTLYYDIATKKSIGASPLHLEIGQNYTILFIWNTVDVPCGNYTLTAVATIPTGSNTFTDGNITIRLPGDSNGDGFVNLKDIALVARAFGSNLGSPRWNAALDLNSDGVVNMQDITLVARNFGKHSP